MLLVSFYKARRTELVLNVGVLFCASPRVYERWLDGSLGNRKVGNSRIQVQTRDEVRCTGAPVPSVRNL